MQNNGDYLCHLELTNPKTIRYSQFCTYIYNFFSCRKSDELLFVVPVGTSLNLSFSYYLEQIGTSQNGERFAAQTLIIAEISG